MPHDAKPDNRQVLYAQSAQGEGVASPVTAVKVDDWIFITGCEAFTCGTADDGQMSHTAFSSSGRSPLRREAGAVLQSVKGLLEALGSDVSRSLRIDQYYSDPRAVDPYHIERMQTFGETIPPSTSVLMDACLADTSTLSISVIAHAGPDEAGKRIFPQNPDIPVASASFNRFVPAIEIGDYLFVAGQMAILPGAGLAPAARLPEGSRWGGSEIRKQTEYVIKKLSVALEAGGSSLSKCVKAQVYLADLEDYDDFFDVWNRHFKDVPCAVTVMPVAGFGTYDIKVEINVIALSGTTSITAEKIADAKAFPGLQGPCVQAGHFVFLSGIMQGGWTGARPKDALQALGADAYERARQTYALVDQICAGQGVGMADAVRVQYCLSDIADMQAITRAWDSASAGAPHPYVAAQVSQRSQHKGIDMVADIWLYRQH